MSNRTLPPVAPSARLAPLVLGTVVALAALATGRAVQESEVQESEVKEADLRGLAKSLSAWLDARVNKKEKLEKAEEELADTLAKLSKKLGKDALSLPDAFGEALWMSRDYEKAKGIRPGRINEVEYPVADEPFEFAVLTPKKYSAREGPYPVILCIPEEDEDPKTHLTEKWLADELRDNVILAAPTMPEDVAAWSESMVDGAVGGIGFLLTTYKAVAESYAIDFDRVYLAGWGMAGVETAMLVANYFPDRFAGVIGRVGDVGDVQPDNFRNLPTLLIGAGSKATEFEKRAKELGYEGCTLKPEGKDEDVWQWLQGLERVSYPDEVSLVQGRAGFPFRSYWLEVPRSDGQGDPWIKARLEREANTVHVEAHGIDRVTLYLNDALVDLDQPVKVICNGAQNLDVVPRSLKTTTQLIFKAVNDPGRVFVAEREYSIPAAEEEAADGG